MDSVEIIYADLFICSFIQDLCKWMEPLVSYRNCFCVYLYSGMGYNGSY